MSDYDEVFGDNRCSVCGGPNSWGSRHSQCGDAVITSWREGEESGRRSGRREMFAEVMRVLGKHASEYERLAANKDNPRTSRMLAEECALAVYGIMDDLRDLDPDGRGET